MNKVSLAAIAKTIVSPRALKIEGLTAAARETLDLMLTRGWAQNFVCGFDENGELSALWLGHHDSDVSAGIYGFVIEHLNEVCAIEAWAGPFNQVVAGEIRDGAFVPTREEQPFYWDDKLGVLVPVADVRGGVHATNCRRCHR